MGVEVSVAAGVVDLEQMIAVRAAIDPLLEITVDEVRFWRRQLRAPLDLLATLDAEPAGFGFAGVFPEDEDAPFAFAELGVRPEHRCRGVGSALHTALSDHVRALGKHALQLEVREEDEAALAYFEKRGYVEVERQKALGLDLDAVPAGPPKPPPGIEIVSWAARPDALARMHALYTQANEDIPGVDSETALSFDEWRGRELERPSRRHDLSFIAFAGDDLVGLATLDVLPAGGFHGLTAVARPWRRRGVGRALKETQIAAAKAAGVKKLFTESEERNEPMRRLNAELGFRPVPGMILLRGPLAKPHEERSLSQL